MRSSYLDILQLCVDFSLAMLKRPLTFDEWNSLNKDVMRYRKTKKNKY